MDKNRKLVFLCCFLCGITDDIAVEKNSDVSGAVTDRFWSQQRLVVVSFFCRIPTVLL